MVLPTNLDALYSDDAADPSKKAHQQHHDAVHALHNAVEAGLTTQGDLLTHDGTQIIRLPKGASAGRVLTTLADGTLGWTNPTSANDPIYDAAGDIVVGTGPDAAARLARGAAHQVLSVNAAGTTLEYRPLTQVARVLRGAVQSIPNATSTAISWDTEVLDDNGFWSSAAPTRLTFPLTGVYLITAGVRFAANATGMRRVDILLNSAALRGAMSVQAAPGGTGFDTNLGVSNIYQFAAGDYVEIRVEQHSGGALDIGAGGHEYTFAALQLLRRV